jgi:VanZ family protein
MRPADASAMTPIKRSPRSHLPHLLAALYAAAIVFASLAPFGPWLAPPASTPFWALSPDVRSTRFDWLVNVVAYLPLGFFAALMPRRAHPVRRIAVGAGTGFVLSFAMETAQAYLPTRDASLIDWFTNTLGAATGGVLAARFARSATAKRMVADARHRFFLPGKLGDAGLALLALWLVAQSNPAIGLFAISFDPSLAAGAAAPRDAAAFLGNAFESLLLTLGLGLFVALLVRERRHFGLALLATIVVASASKGVVAAAMLRPAPWQSWLRPEVSFGIAVGVLLLLALIHFARPVLIVASTVALILSVVLPPIVSDSQTSRVALALFDWRYGQLLNFNGLTHTVLRVWPLAAATWLFALAGQPQWGAADRDAGGASAKMRG